MLAGAGDAPARDDVDALLRQADLERAEGRDAAARKLLERAIGIDFSAHGAHGRLIELTGKAPTDAPASTDEALARVAAHPYDPAALAEAGSRLAADGATEEAVPFLEKSVWLMDFDIEAGRRALALLPSVDPAWAQRRAIPVRVFADESVRADPHWDFRVRLLFLGVSSSLDPVLATRFVPLELTPLRSGGGPLELEPWFDRFRNATFRLPPGIVTVFSERRAPSRRRLVRNGLAEFLGRHLAVRLEPGETASRVLAHEILHLYGGIHVSPDLQSLMNPSGESRRLDLPNQEIARATRERSFVGAGFDRDVLAHVDTERLIVAYTQALGVNMLFRNAGVARALQSSAHPGPQGAREARRATGLDPHLADVSRMLARLMLADSRRGEALLLLDSAARLYGNTDKGREARAARDALADEMEKLYRSR